MLFSQERSGTLDHFKEACPFQLKKQTTTKKGTLYVFNGDHMLRDLTINLGVIEREEKPTQNTYQNK